MNTAARFEFDIVAEMALMRRAAGVEPAMAPLPSPEQVAAAYHRTARLTAAHASLMRSIW